METEENARQENEFLTETALPAENASTDGVEMVRLHDGTSAPEEDSVMLTFGRYKGQWCLEEDAVELKGDEWCHADDDYEYIDGDNYHPDQFEEYGIDYDYWNERYEFERNMTWGYVDRNQEGQFHHDAPMVCCNGVNYMTEDVAQYHDVYYHHHLGEYRHVDDDDFNEDNEDDDEDDDNALAPYHSLSRRDYSAGAEWRFGVEIEKEDQEARNDSRAAAVHARTGWCKECDGSLSDNAGFELVSPVYDLYSEEMFAAIENDRYLSQMVAAAAGTNCGGHMNLSHREYGPAQVFRMLSGWMPFFFALYEWRVRRGEYCPARKKDEMLFERQKYQAVAIHENRIEFRFFSAVKHLTQLRWRANLLRIACRWPTEDPQDVLRMARNPRHPLHRHLLRVYTAEEIRAKCRLSLEMAQDYEFLLNPEPAPPFGATMEGQMLLFAESAVRLATPEQVRTSLLTGECLPQQDQQAEPAFSEP